MNDFLRLMKHCLPKGSVLGIDIGTGAVKLAEIIFKQDHYILNAFSIVDLPQAVTENGFSMNCEYLQKIFCKLIAQSGCSVRKAMVSIGSCNAFIRELKFPLMNDRELREALKWEIEKYVPYETGTYYYDFIVIAKEKNGTEQTVLLAAMLKNVVDGIIDAAKHVGITIMGITIEQLAVLKTFSKKSDFLLLDVGANFSQLTVFQHKKPVLVRSIPVGGKNFTISIMKFLNISWGEAELLKKKQQRQFGMPQGQVNLLQLDFLASLEELTAEVKRTVEYYRQQYKDVNFAEFYLTGGGAQLSFFPKYLSEHLGLPVVRHNVLESISAAPSFDSETIQKCMPQLAVAIGLGLQKDGDDKMNLLPSKIITTVWKRKAAIFMVMFFFSALTGYFSYNAWQIYAMKQELKELGRQQLLLQPTRGKLEKASSTLQYIRHKNDIMVSLTKNNIAPYVFVARLGIVTPTQVRLTEVAITDGINIKGQAANAKEVAAFIDQLNRDIYFFEPMLISVQENLQQQLVDFAISVKLRGP